MKILSRTTEEEILKPGYYKPMTALFQFVNAGNTAIYINNRELLPGETWGIDNTMFLAAGLMAGKEVTVQEVTEYLIRFGTTVVDPGVGVLGNVVTPIVKLIRTEYQIYK